MSDRRVHATFDGRYELVRYDRAGRYYIERTDDVTAWSLTIDYGGGHEITVRSNKAGRAPVPVGVAVLFCGRFDWTPGVPGGRYLDAQVRREKRLLRGDHGVKPCS